MRFSPPQIHIGLLIATAAVFLWSAVAPRDLLTWFMEIAPAAIAIPVLIWIYPRYRFTTLAYVLIARQDRAIARLDVATAAPAPVS